MSEPTPRVALAERLRQLADDLADGGSWDALIGELLELDVAARQARNDERERLRTTVIS